MTKVEYYNKMILTNSEKERGKVWCEFIQLVDQFLESDLPDKEKYFFIKNAFEKAKIKEMDIKKDAIKHIVEVKEV